LIHGHFHKPPGESRKIIEFNQMAVEPVETLLQHFIGVIVVAQVREDEGVQIDLNGSAKLVEGSGSLFACAS
jgi:hypothetical protein